MSKNIGRIAGINGNLLKVEFEQPIIQNEVAYACVESEQLKLKSEVIRVRGNSAELQVFENTTGLKIGDAVEFTGNLLSVELGPGLLGQVFDGLQNPLSNLSETYGSFLQRGKYLDPLSRRRKWLFTPKLKRGDTVVAGEAIGSVPEGLFKHQVMAPFNLRGRWSVERIVPAGEYTVEEVVAALKDGKGNILNCRLMQTWPIKIPIKCYAERLRPNESMVTKLRTIDTFFPVAKGGTFCVPGPFGAGKTVLQQIISRNADVDIVIIAACGERAGEVVETLIEFPELRDPRTGKSLMERTIIICNTSSMPVAAREASVYTGITLAEYYRQMGLDVLLLADSTSRWAQALREMSGRLEEIPGEEAFPAYLESVIASFYERGGIVKLNNGQQGSVTIGGTVSPAGGNFEEPVTQATLKVVGAFHGLSRARSDARRYPAIDPLGSWSKYSSVVDEKKVERVRRILCKGSEVGQMMKVVGEEGISINDFILHLKSEYIDATYLQQNAFIATDTANSVERQKYVFDELLKLMQADMRFEDKGKARVFFQQLTQICRDWNNSEFQSDEFKRIELKMNAMLAEFLNRGG